MLKSVYEITEFSRHLLHWNSFKVITLVVIPAKLVTLKCQNPEFLITIHYDIMNAIAVYGSVVPGIKTVHFKIITIITAYSRPSAKPHKSILVFCDTMDSTLRQPLGISDMLKFEIQRLRE